jgi:hypothetical protein
LYSLSGVLASRPSNLETAICEPSEENETHSNIANRRPADPLRVNKVRIAANAAPMITRVNVKRLMRAPTRTTDFSLPAAAGEIIAGCCGMEIPIRGVPHVDLGLGSGGGGDPQRANDASQPRHRNAPFFTVDHRLCPEPTPFESWQSTNSATKHVTCVGQLAVVMACELCPVGPIA